jgi:hypothetical protein
MLYEFLEDHRAVLINRCRAMVADRSTPKVADEELAYGVPRFLDQLINTLRIEQTAESAGDEAPAGRARSASAGEIGGMAMLHGRDLLRRGFTLEQVVHDYGDVCQSITNLAYEVRAPIEVFEFRTLNRCLDTAIAGAVTEYARRASSLATADGLLASRTRMGLLAVQLRNLIHTATLAVGVIKGGNVGPSGVTGAVLDRCLIEMSVLIDRALEATDGGTAA